MGFEIPAAQPKAEKEPDLYDAAKEEMMGESAQEKNPSELSEEEQEISRHIAEQWQKEGDAHEGVLRKIADKAKAKVAIAAFLMTTAMASVAEARGGQSFLGREVERAIGGIINDAARGAGEALGNIFRRGGKGETPREQERRVQEIQRQDEDFNREYFQIMRQYEQDAQRITEEYNRVMDRLQYQYTEKGEAIPDKIKKQAEDVYKSRMKQSGLSYSSKIEKINNSHSLRHRDENGKNITGCMYPNGFPLPDTRSNF